MTLSIARYRTLTATADDTDYIVQGPNSSNQDIMLINNGDGKSYHTIPIPQTTLGDGDVATAIPNWHGTGRAAFLVTNGRWGKQGPVQLITFTAE